ncbi:NAD(P)/FAD-dependent oxidoreductase [Verrucomicrobiota bacterium sgz303538]
MENTSIPQFDVIIVGGGPAGLSAALVLGRCRRSVLVIDAGKPRNLAAKAMYGFLSRDGESPHEMLQIARKQIEVYDGVKFRDGDVEKAERGHERFTVTTEDGARFSSRILLLATGIVDEIPKLKSIERFWGTSVHVCPYCHGWEVRDQRIVVHGRGVQGAEFAFEMLGWSRDLIFCTDGPAELPEEYAAKLERMGILVVEEKIAQLEGEGEQLRAVRFESGRALECQALFFSSSQKQCSSLAHQLGCELDEEGALIEHCGTAASGVPGLYVAGNTCTGLQLVIIAAAEGTQAAFKINQALIEADVDRADAAIAQSKPVPQPNTIMAS